MTPVIIRTALTGLRNGLPGTGAERAGYVYRGTGRDVLTAWMDDPRLRSLCGRIMPGGQVCGRREGHSTHCKSREAMETDRAKAAERSRKSRQRRAA